MTTWNLFTSANACAFFVFLLNPFFLEGQIGQMAHEMLWQRTPEGRFSFEISDMVQSSRGPIALTGVLGDGSHDEILFYLLNRDGEELVVRKVHEGGKYKMAALTESSDGGYLLAGNTGSGNKDAMLIKLDASGQILWQRTAESPENSHFNDIISLPDGNILAAGRRNGQAILVQYNLEGQLLWEKILSQTIREVLQICLDNRNELGLLGTDQLGRNVFLKTDLNGQVVGQLNLFHTTDPLAAPYLLFDAEYERFVICGTIVTSTLRQQIALLHLDPAGTTLNTYLYGGPKEETAITMIKTGSGYYAVAAMANGHQRLARKSQGLLLFVDAATWEEASHKNCFFGGTQSDQPQTLLQLYDGTILVAGSSRSGARSKEAAWIHRFYDPAPRPETAFYDGAQFPDGGVATDSQTRSTANSEFRVNILWRTPDFKEIKDTLHLIDLNKLRLAITITSNVPLDRKQLLLNLNGSPALIDRDFDFLQQERSNSGPDFYRYEFELMLKFSELINQIDFKVVTRDGMTAHYPNRRSFITRYHPARKTLFLIAVGIPRNLDFSAGDAAAFAAAMEKQTNKTYQEVRVHLLNTPRLTEAGRLRDTISKIFSQYQNVVTRQPVEQVVPRSYEIMLYISSHAYLEGGFRIPGSIYDNDHPTEYIDFEEEILPRWNRFPGLKYLFIDACQNTQVTSPAWQAPGMGAKWETAIDSTDSFAFFSCRPREFSFEHRSWGHGAFTKALLEAFQDKRVRTGNESLQADMDRDQAITVTELFYFVRDRVGELLRTVRDGVDRVQTPYMPASQLNKGKYRTLYILP